MNFEFDESLIKTEIKVENDVHHSSEEISNFGGNPEYFKVEDVDFAIKQEEDILISDYEESFEDALILPACSSSSPSKDSVNEDSENSKGEFIKDLRSIQKSILIPIKPNR